MSQSISVIVAVDSQGGFSKNGKIPWHFTEDFQHFRALTLGHTCVMGRTTYEDINDRLGDNAHPDVLPNRRNIVLTKTIPFLSNAETCESFDDLQHIINDTTDDVFFIGGESIFKYGLSIADTVYLTHIPGNYECELIFPISTLMFEFTMLTKHTTQTGLTFIKMIRNKTVDGSINTEYNQ